MISLTLSRPAEAKIPAGLKGTLSIVPGLGQVTNGNFLEGLGWFSSTVALSLTSNSYLRQIGFDLWQYNMYDAYRDAKPSGNVTTNYSLFSNAIAPFNPINIVDPIGAPVVATGALAGYSRGYTGLRNPAKILMYSFVGLGEEGLFRGFLFPSFTSLFFSSKWAGAITSSAVFAVAHVTGGAANLSTSALSQRFILGMLFCWQANRNQYDLRDGIFAHAWYDILVDQDPSKIGAAVHFAF